MIWNIGPYFLNYFAQNYFANSLKNTFRAREN
jgi:hypothetical protein